MKYNIKKYFSIIELLLTCVVIAILMSIGLGVYRLVVDKIQETKTKSLIKKIEMAMRAYRHETGYYFQLRTDTGSQGPYVPLIVNQSDEEFRKLIDYTAMRNNGQIDSSGNVKDTWGNNVMYTCPGVINTTLFDVGSMGKNGKWGDDDASDTEYFGTVDDITNTNM
jgi:type II secretory pathway pseudopilin PulG